MTRNQKLIEDYLNGKRIVYDVCGTLSEVMYIPRHKRDNLPWTDGFYRYNSGELKAVPVQYETWSRR